MNANRPRIIRNPVNGRTIQAESYVETKFKDAVRRAGGIPVKMALTGAGGFPDDLLIMPFGRTVYVECKKTGEKLKPRQVKWMYDILDLGHEWYLLDHTDDIESIINRGVKCPECQHPSSYEEQAMFDGMCETCTWG